MFKVDIIIPCFNSEHTVSRAILSALSQQGCEVGVLVVDDGSSDKTAEVAEGFCDSRIKVFRLPGNIGPAGARNFGVQHATEEWVAFLDSDDIWLPGKLRHQLAVLTAPEQVAHAHIVSFRQIRADGRTEVRKLPPSSGLCADLLDVCQTTIGSTLLVRRSLFESVGLFNHELRCFEDWDWQLRCLLSGYRIETSDFVLVEKNEGSKRRSGTVVGLAIAYLRRQILPVVFASFGKRAGRRFEAALFFEECLAAYVDGKYALAFLFLTKSLCRRPQRLSRLFRRLGIRDS